MKLLRGFVKPGVVNYEIKVMPQVIVKLLRGFVKSGVLNYVIRAMPRVIVKLLSQSGKL